MLKKFVIVSLIFFPFDFFAQNNIPDNYTGVHFSYDSFHNCIITTNPRRTGNKSGNTLSHHNDTPVLTNGSYIRYYFTELYGEGIYSAESGNGLYSSVGWSLSNERISLFGNANNTALWDFPTYAVITDYTSISADGGFVSAGAGNFIYVLHGSNGTPLMTFNVQTFNNGTAGMTQITKNGDFLVGSSVKTDTSIILGFNSSSNVPVWQIKVPNELMAINISGNDSLIIANTYLKFWVIKTYTGEIVFNGLINPLNNDGTQGIMGINSDGSIIATINYDGYLIVYRRNGSTYTQLWQYQEPPGTFYNWMASVDISDDGAMVAAGTLDVISPNSFDGKVKLFGTTNGPVPLWVYSGCGDEVSSVAFSKNGKILSAATWGNMSIGSPNLFVFKTTRNDSIPVFRLTAPGSFYSTSVSDDGQTVIASGKAVHARVVGHGGTYYNIFIDTSGVPFGIKKEEGNVLAEFRLYQNYPNPFNPTTTIKFSLPCLSEGGEMSVNLDIFNVIGKKVATLFPSPRGGQDGLSAGTYNITFDSKGLSSGVYFYRLTAGSYNDSKKMIIIK